MFQRDFLALLVASGAALGVAHDARADFAARTCLYLGPSSVRQIDLGNGCLGYEVKPSGGAAPERVTFPRPLSGKLVASPDGRTVVLVQSYLYGHHDRKTNAVVEFEGEANPEVVFIYYDGKLVGRHRIGDLVRRPQFYRNSVSHVAWVRDLSVPRDDARFILDTVDFRRVVFCSKTGRSLEATDHSDVERCHAMAIGSVDLKASVLRDPYFLEQAVHPSKTIALIIPSNISLTHDAATYLCLERVGERYRVVKEL